MKRKIFDPKRKMRFGTGKIEKTSRKIVNRPKLFQNIDRLIFVCYKKLTVFWKCDEKPIRRKTEKMENFLQFYARYATLK